MRAAPAVLGVLSLVLAGCVAPAMPSAQPAVQPSVLDADQRPTPPPTDAGFTSLVCPGPSAERPLEDCNRRATVGNGPANEIDLAVDPADPQHMVVVGKGYRYTRTIGSAFLGKVITPYATTFDGGMTWAEGYLQPLGTTLATIPVLEEEVGITDVSDSDPVVEFAANGEVMAQTLRVTDGREGLPMFRSTDGGVTFEEVGTAYAGTTDKNWMVTDPTTGNMYTVTLHDGGTGFSKSTDNGLSWSAPVKICNCRLPGIDVGPGGVIYVVGVASGQVRFVKSEDQGATWTPTRNVAALNGMNTNPCNLRLFRASSIAVVQASRVSDDVFAVWNAQPAGTPEFGGCPDVPEEDVYMAISRDRGATWSAPLRINDDAPGALPALQFMPQVAVSPNGRDVHVAWFDQRLDPTGLLVEVYYAHSADAGATWGPNLKVSDRPFLTTLSHHQSAVPQHTGVFVGDYIGLHATDDRAVVAFPDTRYGRADIFVATIV